MHQSGSITMRSLNKRAKTKHDGGADLNSDCMLMPIVTSLLPRPALWWPCTRTLRVLYFTKEKIMLVNIRIKTSINGFVLKLRDISLTSCSQLRFQQPTLKCHEMLGFHGWSSLGRLWRLPSLRLPGRDEPDGRATHDMLTGWLGRSIGPYCY